MLTGMSIMVRKLRPFYNTLQTLLRRKRKNSIKLPESLTNENVKNGKTKFENSIFYLWCVVTYAPFARFIGHTKISLRSLHIFKRLCENSN